MKTAVSLLGEFLSLFVISYGSYRLLIRKQGYDKPIITGTCLAIVGIGLLTLVASARLQISIQEFSEIQRSNEVRETLLSEPVAVGAVSAFLIAQTAAFLFLWFTILRILAEKVLGLPPTCFYVGNRFRFDQKKAFLALNLTSCATFGVECFVYAHSPAIGGRRLREPDTLQAMETIVAELVLCSLVLFCAARLLSVTTAREAREQLTPPTQSGGE